MLSEGIFSRQQGSLSKQESVEGPGQVVMSRATVCGVFLCWLPLGGVETLSSLHLSLLCSTPWSPFPSIQTHIQGRQLASYGRVAATCGQSRITKYPLDCGRKLERPHRGMGRAPASRWIQPQNIVAVADHCAACFSLSTVIYCYYGLCYFLR